MNRNPVLISGGGIAGLTLAILLRERGRDVLVVEHEPALPAEGYMMDFFGTGWDVAERMGLTEALRAIRYPIEQLEFVDGDSHARIRIPIDRIRRALHHKYVYLRRTDLARVLYERAQSAAVEIRYGVSVASLLDRGEQVQATFSDGGSGTFDLVFGADGIHSRIRELTFGPEHRFDRFLGYYVAAFHLTDHSYGVDRAFKLYEEPDRLVMLYPLGNGRLDVNFVFRHTDAGHVPPADRLRFVHDNFSGAGWIAARLLDDHPASQPLYFDPTIQIVMPDWHRGRVALLGDACGSLTLLAGQGSHMAMADAYVLAQELCRHGNDHGAAFRAYQSFMKPRVERKQRDAAWLSRMFVPTRQSRPWLRRLVIRLILSAPLAPFTMAYSGATSVLEDR
jgi:2-polyprenyl-6-methoxyphenol hydroxylase-like FAD-dependent oxidoreductase